MFKTAAKYAAQELRDLPPESMISDANEKKEPEELISAAAPSSIRAVRSAFLEVRNLNFYYGETQALRDVSLSIEQHKVTALIGPSGCGKSTLLRCFNRMNDLVDDIRIEGSLRLGGQEIYSREVDVTELRKRVGMVFQKSNPFPKSIYENVAFGLRIHGAKSGAKLDEIVEESLKAVALWDEVKDRLGETAHQLSGGQPQRLCIARAIAVEPEVLLMDEPCSALDPIATAKIEELIHELKLKYTVVIVTHNMQQASRVSDYTAFMLLGKLVEFGLTTKIFQNPDHEDTLDYITGRFG